MAFLNAAFGMFMVFVILPFVLIAVIIAVVTAVMFGILKWRKVTLLDIAASDRSGPPPPVFDGNTGPRGILAKIGPNTTQGE